ncbi:MAG: methyltransferase domain-containing protein [Bacteroidetes bacterium]|nr:methyltransferase domain-containing protein [Bacteroidota bacterium]
MLWRAETLSLQAVLLGALLLRLALLPVAPLLSDDVYRYLWDGLLQWEGMNPYAHRPAEEALRPYHDTLLFEEMNSPEFYSVYPPLSQVFFALAAFFYEAGFEVAYGVLKGSFVSIEMAGVWALSRLVSAQATALYAWNPLVVIEVAGQAHTEAVMVGLLLLALWAVHQRWLRTASVLIAGAGLVKLYPFIFLLVLYARYGWKALWPGVSIALGLMLAYGIPGHALNIIDSLGLYVSYFEFNAGLYFVLMELGWLLFNQDMAQVVSAVLTICALAAIALILWRDTQREQNGVRGVALTLYSVIAMYLLTTTTLHPWYLLPILALLPFVDRAHHPAWLWLSIAAMGTYARYVDGIYWGFVWLSWTGFAVLAGWAIYQHRNSILTWIMKRRARGKAAQLRPLLVEMKPSGEHPVQLLDLGAGEGYMGEVLQQEEGISVMLADVRPSNQTDLPFLHLQQEKLPLVTNAVHVVSLVFVLHHTPNPVEVLREALRVASDRVVIVESTCEGPWWCWWLRRIDGLANYARSGGTMDEQPATFRSQEGWLQAIADAGGVGCVRHTEGTPLHRVVVLEALPQTEVTQSR